MVANLLSISYISYSISYSYYYYYYYYVGTDFSDA